MQEEEERSRREEERALKRQQKTAESAQSSGLEVQQEASESFQPRQQPTMAAPAAGTAAEAPVCKYDPQPQDTQATQQQHPQQQANLQTAAAPASKLTKAQRQR